VGSSYPNNYNNFNNINNNNNNNNFNNINNNNNNGFRKLVHINDPEVHHSKQEVTKRCRLFLMTNSALVYESKCGGRGGVVGLSQGVQLCTSRDMQSKYNTM
jgi:hypothetical protein